MEVSKDRLTALTLKSCHAFVRPALQLRPLADTRPKRGEDLVQETYAKALRDSLRSRRGQIFVPGFTVFCAILSSHRATG